MFGPFGNPTDDRPSWRERLADLRDAPPWRLERPEWMRENAGALLLALAGIACAAMTLAYLAVPPQRLPAAVPGHWQLSAAWQGKATTTTTSSTTTTMPLKERVALFDRIGKLPKEEQAKFWGWVTKVAEVKKQDEADEALANAPPKPPFRRWDLAFLSGVLGALLVVGAWYLSDTRLERTG